MEVTTILVLGLVAITVLVAAVAGIGLWRGPGAFYVRRSVLLSPLETQWLQILDEAAGDEFRVMAKVGVSGLVNLRPRLPRKARRHATARIGTELFDFVLLDRRTLAPVAAVIVAPDDSRRRQSRRHAFRKKLCAAVGLPLVVLDPGTVFSPEYLRRLVEQAIHPPAMAKPAAAPLEPTVFAHPPGD